ncbi:hypothetical protein B296_00034087 [Ensete ventricosum]|uniref:Uncharacterized protein n=1 Tax=Ensete ventricosum TaxID=4639 RepID=A0A426Z5Y3_ENSVE|nr:hypothetical protein B296_00034087 [Ensete ventricosum]
MTHRSWVSEISSHAQSAYLAPGWVCPGHIDRSGRGPIITPIILPSGRRLPWGLVKMRGRVLQVRNSSMGVIRMPAWSCVKHQSMLGWDVNPLRFLCSLLLLFLWLSFLHVADDLCRFSTGCVNASCFQTPFSPPMVSRAGWMSSASSHSESRSVKILARRSRVLGHPSRDSRSTAILSSSGGAAPTNSGATEALATMRSCFNIDSTMMTRQLVEVRKNYYTAPEYELHVPLPGEHPYDTFPSDF